MPDDDSKKESLGYNRLHKMILILTDGLLHAVTLLASQFIIFFINGFKLFSSLTCFMCIFHHFADARFSRQQKIPSIWVLKLVIMGNINYCVKNSLSALYQKLEEACWFSIQHWETICSFSVLWLLTLPNRDFSPVCFFQIGPQMACLGFPRGLCRVTLLHLFDFSPLCVSLSCTNTFL